MVVIDQLAQFTGIRAAEIFLELLQLHLQLADLFEQLGFFDLALARVVAVFVSCEELAGAIVELPLPLAHLYRVDGVIGGDLLDRPAATDRLHGDSGLEFGTMGPSLAHCWEPRSGAVPRIRT